MTVTYSAPAKIILTGEHSVVYGKPALISALDIRLTVTVRDTKQTKENHDIDIIAGHAKEYLKKSGISYEDKPYSTYIQSDIPSRKNLGSSAALSVAASAAFLHFFAGHELSKDAINQVAYQSEKHFHGNPSGGDNSASCFGGFIYYRKEFEFLKNVSALSAKLPKNIMERLFIVDSGKSVEKTSEMVAKVGAFYNEDPKHAEQIMNEIEKVSKRMVIAIVKEDKTMFADAVSKNESCLEELGVVSPETIKLIQSLSAFGVAKVTGGGGFKSGSGNLLFFAQEPERAISIFKERAISFMKFHQDFEGVRREQV